MPPCAVLWVGQSTVRGALRATEESYFRHGEVPPRSQNTQIFPWSRFRFPVRPGGADSRFGGLTRPRLLQNAAGRGVGGRWGAAAGGGLRISVAPGVPARSPVGAAARNTFLSGPWSKKPDSPAVSVGFVRKTHYVAKNCTSPWVIGLFAITGFTNKTRNKLLQTCDFACKFLQSIKNSVFRVY